MFMICKALAFLLLCGLLLVGCSEGEPVIVPTVARLTVVLPTTTPSPIATLTATPLPSATFTPIATATPTLTPTATAVPLTVSGNPRAAQLHEPIPQSGAPCGLVDTLDFPIDPPDAANVSRGGGDFGTFRQRYDKFHAGEDWGGVTGQPNLGTPVYSIGHGLVTYAEPEGWNRDKGVLIVQHVFGDGRSFYSFYGHLDPPSVVLQAGDCVLRGDLVGKIGDPRSSPHLHFEIRSHLPYNPGPGYWPEDPTTAGWLPPSATIWQQRLAASPGVQWVRPEAAVLPQRRSPSTSQGIGMVDAETFAVVEQGQLVGLNVSNGRVRWRYALADEDNIESALMDTAQSAIYLTNQFGEMTALALPGDDLIFTPLWQLDLDTVGFPTLLPLPGGVALLTREQLTAVSATGEIWWEYEFPARPFAWAAADDFLVVTTTGSEDGVWTIDESGVTAWAAPGGRPAIIGNQVWIYSVDGIYRLNNETQAADLLLTLPTALLSFGDMVALPNDGALVAHTDGHDRRLIALNGDGSIRWDRSFAGLVEGEIRLVAADGEPEAASGRVYLIAQTNQNGAGEMQLFAVNLETAALTRLFVGGTRSALLMDNWVMTAGENLLLVNIGGGHLAALNPQLALEMVVR